MRRVIREDILGKSYRCHVAVNVYEENEMSEYELTNKDSNSEVTLSLRHGKENIVIHTHKEIVGESLEIKHDLALQLTTFHKTQGIFNFI